jgi:prepilin-type N-terminal cleavage/methylation domain-containing protein
MIRWSLNLFKFFREQQGFTLLELSLGLLISSIIGLSITFTLMQISSNTDRNIARTMAVKEVESAVHYINRDIQQAQEVKIDGTDYWLRLTWTSWEDNAINQVLYYIEDEMLVRKYTKGNEDPVYIQVSRNIINNSVNKPNPTPTPTTLPSEKTWTITITSEAVSGRITATETREIKIIPRTTS